MELYATLVMVVFGLMLLVNIITEVLKNTFKNKIPINAMVLILSLVVTIVTMFIWLSIASIVFVWWMIPVAIAVAFMVAYSAMFGFDKFKQMVTQWETINSTKR